MSRQTLFEQLAAHYIPANGSASNVVSQKGCRCDDKLTPKEQMDNLKLACRRMESIVQGTEKGHPSRKASIAKLEELKSAIQALRKSYPKQLRHKNNVFDKLLIDDMKLRMTDGEYKAAYRCAERTFEQGDDV